MTRIFTKAIPFSLAVLFKASIDHFSLGKIHHSPHWLARPQLYEEPDQKRHEQQKTSAATDVRDKLGQVVELQLQRRVLAIRAER